MMLRASPTIRTRSMGNFGRVSHGCMRQRTSKATPSRSHTPCGGNGGAGGAGGGESALPGTSWDHPPKIAGCTGPSVEEAPACRLDRVVVLTWFSLNCIVLPPQDIMSFHFCPCHEAPLLSLSHQLPKNHLRRPASRGVLERSSARRAAPATEWLMGSCRRESHHAFHSLDARKTRVANETQLHRGFGGLEDEVARRRNRKGDKL